MAVPCQASGLALLIAGREMMGGLRGAQPSADDPDVKQRVFLLAATLGLAMWNATAALVTAEER